MLLLCAFGSVEPKRGISEFCCKLVCDGVVDSNHTPCITCTYLARLLVIDLKARSRSQSHAKQ
jgi:hypothetical protein